MAAAQAAQVAAATSVAQNKAHSSAPIALLTSNNKQSGSGRKRKSTPEKRVLTNHRSADIDDNVEDFI